MKKNARNERNGQETTDWLRGEACLLRVFRDAMHFLRFNAHLPTKGIADHAR
jgi:hypothetical protein